MRLCLNTDGLGHMSFEEMVKTSAEIGIESLEIACGNWSNAPHIDLDEMGSFIFPLIDGERTVGQIAQLVRERFGADAEPLYERLAKYMQILRNNGFIYYAGKDRAPQ